MRITYRLPYPLAELFRSGVAQTERAIEGAQAERAIEGARCPRDTLKGICHKLD